MPSRSGCPVQRTVGWLEGRKQGESHCYTCSYSSPGEQSAGRRQDRDMLPAQQRLCSPHDAAVDMTL